LPASNKKAVIVVSDLHINSTVALSKPTVNLDDGGTYRASRIQRELWDSWLDYVEKAKNLTKGYQRIVVFNGDVGELDTKRRSYQLTTINKATIIRAAIDTTEPLLEIADEILVIRGTPAHSGKGSWLEETIANDLDHVITPLDGSASSHYHARIVIAGVRFDFAHHGRMGNVRQTYKNAANRLTGDTIDKYRDNEWAIPNVIVRSHVHRRADSGRNYPALGLFTPSWQMITEFGYRIGAENDLSDIGGDVFLCDGGEYTWHDFRYKPKASRVWALKI
jgi:hypothetical protein